MFKSLLSAVFLVASVTLSQAQMFPMPGAPAPQQQQRPKPNASLPMICMPADGFPAFMQKYEGKVVATGKIADNVYAVVIIDQDPEHNFIFGIADEAKHMFCVVLSGDGLALSGIPEAPQIPDVPEKDTLK